jgi:hypothetical protein
MSERKVPAPGESAAFAEYAATVSADLATLARRHGLQTLGYLLDMARLEAENLCGQAKRTDAH